MNRRGFLGAIAAAVAGAVLDPEQLLWVPGGKLISVPPVRVAKIGRTLYIRRPARFVARDGLGFQPESITSEWYPLVVVGE